MSDNAIKLEESWKAALAPEFEKDYMKSLKAFLQAELQAGKTIFPKGSEYFSALDLTPVDKVKVVIIGQDPYHGPEQAHGLSFSVKPGVKIPPSLVNIYKEQEEDLGIKQPGHGYLASWAEQGVLMLNAVLTVQAHNAASHQGRGWEIFTDAIISELNQAHEGLVFILWGSYAQKKGKKIDRNKHLVLAGPHPSPLSAYRGFFGCKHFSKANDYLQSLGKEPINWQVPELSE
ncbi:uracil-DNA glycosylase [Kordiimonas sp. SCSIO 12603]|uniref:uracil-DNA glycosylase n=1 Tax=Kordiimonas sp. SCSIO 12603 TaxID=2829596 RepID=UPI0021022FC2|nr:uracil-DNA glycosylase [Kordiimonas sp. SCSIO 12603]UTW58402.1 uracil-DNA glycosylase [Kordiimonas sp. SCSIO 12603]